MIDKLSNLEKFQIAVDILARDINDFDKNKLPHHLLPMYKQHLAIAIRHINEAYNLKVQILGQCNTLN